MADISWRRVFKVALVNLLVLAVLLGLIEVTARILFPDFKNQVFSETRTSGIEFYTSKDPLGQSTRVPQAGAKTNVQGDRLVLVLGDSISAGYGTAYEDIYWVKLSRLLSAAGEPLRFASPSSMGNNLEDSVSSVTAALRSNQNVKFILYQFNQNDVMPLTRQTLHQTGPEPLPTLVTTRFAKWRYQYINYSVASRVIQHYAGIMSRRTKGSCEERGFDGLGQYTYTYGNRAYAKESEALWRDFEARLVDLSKYASRSGIGFAVFLTPNLYDIDKKRIHPYTWALNLDFSCATIDPHSRLRQLSEREGIVFIDPTDYMRQGFESRMAEGNFTPFFFPSDDNHFTPAAGQYLAEYLFQQLREKLR